MMQSQMRLLSLQTDEACRDFGDIAADMPDEEEDHCHPWRVSHVTCWIELATYWLVQNSCPWSDWRVFMFQSPSLWAAQIVFDGPMKAAEAAALTSLMSADPSGASSETSMAFDFVLHKRVFWWTDGLSKLADNSSFLTRCSQRCGAEAATDPANAGCDVMPTVVPWCTHWYSCNTFGILWCNTAGISRLWSYAQRMWLQCLFLWSRLHTHTSDLFVFAVPGCSLHWVLQFVSGKYCTWSEVELAQPGS